MVGFCQYCRGSLELSATSFWGASAHPSDPRGDDDGDGVEGEGHDNGVEDKDDDDDDDNDVGSYRHDMLYYLPTYLTYLPTYYYLLATTTTDVTTRTTLAMHENRLRWPARQPFRQPKNSCSRATLAELVGKSAR